MAICTARQNGLVAVEISCKLIRVWETFDNSKQAYDIDVGRAVSGIVSWIKRHSVYKMRVLGYSRGGDGAMSSPPTLFTLGGYIFYDSSSTLVLPAISSATVSSSYIITIVLTKICLYLITISLEI
uniref:Uncharacterized protein n=1 Tax=Magallana gigas TaxID=29159 RepID=A0A8W8LNU6_MAGGI